MAKRKDVNLDLVANAPTTEAFVENAEPAEVVDTMWTSENEDGEGYIGLRCQRENKKVKLLLSYEQISKGENWQDAFEVVNGKNYVRKGIMVTVNDNVAEFYNN